MASFDQRTPQDGTTWEPRSDSGRIRKSTHPPIRKSHSHLIPIDRILIQSTHPSKPSLRSVESASSPPPPPPSSSLFQIASCLSLPPSLTHSPHSTLTVRNREPPPMPVADADAVDAAAAATAPTTLRGAQLLLAWSGVIAIAYRGLPAALTELKAKVGKAMPSLPPENPGSKVGHQSCVHTREVCEWSGMYLCIH